LARQLSAEDRQGPSAALENVRKFNDEEGQNRLASAPPELIDGPDLLGWHLDRDVLDFLHAQAPCSTSTNTTTPPVQTNREFLKGDTDEPTAATMGPDQAVTRIAFKLSWIEKSRPEWSPPEPSSRV